MSHSGSSSDSFKSFELSQEGERDNPRSPDEEKNALRARDEKPVNVTVHSTGDAMRSLQSSLSDVSASNQTTIADSGSSSSSLTPSSGSDDPNQMFDPETSALLYDEMLQQLRLAMTDDMKYEARDSYSFRRDLTRTLFVATSTAGITFFHNATQGDFTTALRKALLAFLINGCASLLAREDLQHVMMFSLIGHCLVAGSEDIGTGFLQGCLTSLMTPTAEGVHQFNQFFNQPKMP